jgi:hypothetical protein
LDIQIIGADAFQMVDLDSEIRKTITFIEAVIQSVNGQSEVLFFAESNYGGAPRAQQAYRLVMKWAKATPYKIRGILAHDRNRSKPGFWLTRATKEKMALRTKTLLDSRRIRVAKGFIAPKLGGPNAALKLWTQLENYERRYTFDPDVDGENQGSGRAREEPIFKVVYSGKTEAESDDMAVILQEAILLQWYHSMGQLGVTPVNTMSRPAVLNPRVRARDGTVEDHEFAQLTNFMRQQSEDTHLIWGARDRGPQLRDDEDHDAGEEEDRAALTKDPLKLVDEFEQEAERFNGVDDHIVDGRRWDDVE